MYIQLEQEDYDAIAEIISSEEDTKNGYVNYYDDVIEIHFSKIVRGECYDDYNVSECHTITSVDFEIKEILAPCDVKYDACKLQKTIEEMLWRC